MSREAAFTELCDGLEKSFAGLDYSIRLKRLDDGKAMQRILALDARSLAKRRRMPGRASPRDLMESFSEHEQQVTES